MPEWLTLECERALYVDHGRTAVLCDRLPSPVTLIVKLAAQETEARRAETGTGSVHDGPVAESDAPKSKSETPHEQY